MTKGQANYLPLRVVKDRWDLPERPGYWAYLLSCGHVVVRVPQHREYQTNRFPLRARCKECYGKGERKAERLPKKGATA